jgi:hypothetical protein
MVQLKSRAIECMDHCHHNAIILLQYCGELYLVVEKRLERAFGQRGKRRISGGKDREGDIP